MTNYKYVGADMRFYNDPAIGAVSPGAVRALDELPTDGRWVPADERRTPPVSPVDAGDSEESK